MSYLELHILLLLFLHQQLLLDDFLGLLYQTLLQRLHLLDHVVRVRVAALQLAPSEEFFWLISLV